MKRSTFLTIVNDMVNYHEDRACGFTITTKNGRIYEASADAYEILAEDCLAIYGGDDNKIYIAFEEIATIEA